MGIGCLTNSLIDEGHCQSGRRRSLVPSSTTWRKCHEVGTWPGKNSVHVRPAFNRSQQYTLCTCSIIPARCQDEYMSNCFFIFSLWRISSCGAIEFAPRLDTAWKIHRLSPSSYKIRMFGWYEPSLTPSRCCGYVLHGKVVLRSAVQCCTDLHVEVLDHWILR